MTYEQAAMALQENTTDFSKFLYMKDIKDQVPVRSEGRYKTCVAACVCVCVFSLVIFITVHID